MANTPHPSASRMGFGFWPLAVGKPGLPSLVLRAGQSPQTPILHAPVPLPAPAPALPSLWGWGQAGEVTGGCAGQN